MKFTDIKPQNLYFYIFVPLTAQDYFCSSHGIGLKLLHGNLNNFNFFGLKLLLFKLFHSLFKYETLTLNQPPKICVKLQTCKITKNV